MDNQKECVVYNRHKVVAQAHYLYMEITKAVDCEEVGRINRNKTGEIRISITTWNKTRAIDIRVYYLDGDGKWLPTRKGLALRKQDIVQFEELWEEAKKLL